MRQLVETIKPLKIALNASLEELRVGKESLLLELKQMRIQINVVLDSLETTIIEKYDNKHKQFYDQISSDILALDKAESDTTLNCKVMNINKIRATNTQFLFAQQQVESKQKEVEGKVKELYNRGRKILHLNTEKITSDLKSVLEKQINDIPAVIVESQPFLPVMTESSSVAIVEEREHKTLFVGVQILKDGRNLVLDHSRSVLRLMSNEHEQTCQIFIRNAKQFASLSRDFIAVFLNEDDEGLKLLKIVGTKLAPKGEIRSNIKCFGMSKYLSSIILLCAKEQSESECSISFYPKEVTFKLLREDKTLVNFDLPVKKPISPWRGFLYDSQSNEFVAICEDGKSLMWIEKSGHIRQERKFEDIGRGGLSGLAVDNQGRLFVAATRKIYEIGPNGQILHTIKANINVYSIAVSETGNKLIAVGHNNSMEVFTIRRIHPFK